MSRLNDIKKTIETVQKVPLGELIEQCDERNSNGIYHIDDVKGVSINKVIIDTKADMNGVSLAPYKLFKPSQFCFVPITSRNGERITLSINNHGRTYIVSSSYCVFNVIDQERLLPMYLYLILCRPEFDRYSRFNSWGSAREAFSFDEMCRVRIPLPPIDVQKEYVDAYDGLQQLILQNEAILKPLAYACQAYMAEVQSQYSEVLLGDYIVEVNERNEDGEFTADDVRGVSIQKKFIDTKANMDGVSVRNYKVVRPDDFAFNVNTARMGEKFAIALSSINCIVTSIYGVFRVKRIEDLDPAYLYLYFNRTEFDRYVRFNSWGSARETFNMPDVFNIRIPLPPIEVQQSIVALHRCAEEARSIATEARETLRRMCPAMVQRAAHHIR